MNIANLTIASERAAIAERVIPAMVLAEAFCAKIKAEDREIHAWLTLCEDRALAQAQRIDELGAHAGKSLPPLVGVPVGVKDVMVTNGVRMTAGSKILENFVPPYDCPAVARLEAAGAIILGKTNCDEFAMGSSNENSAYGPVRNPHDKSRVPGGSSGGSAAAVASGMAVATLGSDTGGSIPQPASFCGAGGLRPTYRRAPPYRRISLPHTPYAVPTYYVIATAEASANLARYDGVRYGYRSPQAHTLAEMYRRSRDEGFGAEVKRRIMLGTYALSAGYYDAYYLKAQKVRTLLARDFETAFQKVDAIVTPTAPTPAFKIGEKTDDPLAMYLADIYTVTGDLAGVPGISVPCGQTRSGLPIGLQILGRHFDEGTVLRVAQAVEDSANNILG